MLKISRHSLFCLKANSTGFPKSTFSVIFGVMALQNEAYDTK